MGLKPENFFFASGREFMGGGLKPGKDISPSRGVRGPQTRGIFLEWNTPFLQQLFGNVSSGDPSNPGYSNPKQPPGQSGKLRTGRRKVYAFSWPCRHQSTCHLPILNETCPEIPKDVLQMGSLGMSPRWAWGASLLLLATWTEQKVSQKLESS